MITDGINHIFCFEFHFQITIVETGFKSNKEEKDTEPEKEEANKCKRSMKTLRSDAGRCAVWIFSQSLSETRAHNCHTLKTSYRRPCAADHNGFLILITGERDLNRRYLAEHRWFHSRWHSFIAVLECTCSVSCSPVVDNKLTGFADVSPQLN